MEQEQKKNHLIAKGVAITAVIVVGIYGTVKLGNKKSAIVITQEQQNPITTEINPNIDTAIAFRYKDGTYSAVGTYGSPAGPEQMGVSIVLKNDVIVDATVEPKTEVPISKKIQTMFAENFKQFVVGKNINEVTLDKVSGASLTPKGFNDAVKQIKSQAAI